MTMNDEQHSNQEFWANSPIGRVLLVIDERLGNEQPECAAPTTEQHHPGMMPADVDWRERARKVWEY